MKRFIFYLVFSLVLVFASCDFAAAQNINAIKARCPSPNTSFYGSVLVQRDGNINAVPCPTGTFQINGAAVVAGGVTGSGTANFIPRFATSTSLSNTPFSWDATSYLFNNTALDSEFTLGLTPSTTVGRFRVGDFTTTPTNFIDLSQSAGQIILAATANITANSKTGTFLAGDSLTAGNGTVFSVNDSTKVFTFSSTTSTSVIDETGVISFRLNRTTTPAGTTGGVTINKPNGTVNFAAGGSANITVLNNTIIANSLVFAMAQVNDTTCAVKAVTPNSSGFVTITMTATCTAETKVAFWVTN